MESFPAILYSWLAQWDSSHNDTVYSRGACGRASSTGSRSSEEKAEQEKLLFKAQLSALKVPAQPPAPQLEAAEGETTPKVKSLTAVLPGIAATHLITIHKNRFLAENLSKLRRGRWEEDTTGLIC
jgi:hypothetical protein